MIFFDIDDTLLDHSLAEKKGAIDFLHNHSSIIQSSDEDFVDLWSAISDRYFKQYLAREISFQEQRRSRIKDIFEHYNVVISNDVADTKFDEYLECYKNNWVAFHDVIPCLREFKDVDLGIISNGDYQQQIEKLEKLQINSFFSCIVTSSEAGYSKPDKSIFIEACTRVGKNIDACCYIGDRMDTDALGSKLSGMTGVWLNRRKRAIPEDIKNEIIVIESLKELRRTLKGRFLS